MHLVKFYKDNCGPCTRVDNYLKDQEVQFVSINAIKEPKKAAAFKIGMSVPVVLLMDGDEEVKRINGFNEAVLEEMISLL